MGRWEGSGLDGERENSAYPEGFGEGNGGKQLQADCLFTTGIFAEEIYDHLKDNNLLPDEQKGCRKKSRGTKDQLLVDKAIMLEARRKRRFLGMAWVDYKKAYDMVPHSWLMEVVEMMGVADNVRLLLGDSMKEWRTELTADGKSLGVVDIKRGIFQGDSLSPQLFVMIMDPCR